MNFFIIIYLYEWDLLRSRLNEIDFFFFSIQLNEIDMVLRVYIDDDSD